MKIWIQLSCLSFGILFLVSCATTSPNLQMVIGSWKPLTIEKYQPDVKPNDTSKVQSTKANAEVSDRQLMDDEKNFRFMKEELSASFEIRTDKTATKYYHGSNNKKATWKMNRKGTMITTKEIATGIKYKLEIVKVTETNLMIIEKLPFGEFKIFYARQ